MSGHSKWSTIKRKKGKADKERGKLFSRLIKDITVAARESGGDPDGNPRLRTAIAVARAANMPAQNIERAVKKGTGELEGVRYEPITFEGYGPAGVAILVEGTTDNRNRIVAAVRHIFSHNGGNLAEGGAVAWQFSPKGLFVVPRDQIAEDALLNIALEGDAEDVRTEEDDYELECALGDFDALRTTLEDAGLQPSQAVTTQVPTTQIQVDGKEAERVLRLIEALEDHDDIEKVYANFDIDEAILEQVS